MTSLLREVLTDMREHGVPAGAVGPDGQRCLALTVVECHRTKLGLSTADCWKQASFNKAVDDDLRLVNEVLSEQYPEYAGFVPRFSDTMGAEGRDEEVFRVLEKAILRQEERI